ncbi:hypothetical protein M413DRAFT_449525 [Hebeloma cylindrosporum]|uniref:Uncharacterized protein n=1 Tax=Hebeloma cylindrosporum TaxID=76867 RepID=A0A0C3BGP1_HEBCY|nr:hypothetical protein M413DRAFT_449525 [Hebeloma cylindrosporum h7]
MSLPPFVVRLIGIGKYDKFPHLRPEGDTNAKDLSDFLKGDPNFNHDIDMASATEPVTRDKIFEMFMELRKSVDRSKATLVFFSGIGGSLGSGGPSIICPADIGVNDKSKGITDQELVSQFDSISRFRGNNITFLMDCPSSQFKWGNPNSFVVISPRTATSENPKAFTQSIIEVLSREKDSLAFLTVQSFADKVQTFMSNGIEVDCRGLNVDRLLFNPRKGKAHHAFIRGRAETDGTLTLFAGSAHGVTEDSTFGIYHHHIAHNQSPIVHLQTERVQDSTTSKLRLPSSDFKVPPVFYAVETRCPLEPVDIFKPVDINLHQYRSWNEGEEGKTNITLERLSNSDTDKVKIFWNGFADPGRIKPGPENCLFLPADELDKVIRHAARFKYIVGSLANTVSPPLFKVKFQEISTASGQPTGDNLLKGDLVELDIQGGEERMYCLAIRNLAKFAIWPFVFRCDPREFKIEPLYTPTQPLAPESKLIIGGGDGDSLMFEQWKSDPGPALTYVKIFATKTRTSFSFLTQDRSSIENKLREVGEEAKASSNNSDGEHRHAAVQPATETEKRKSDTKEDWQTRQITVQRTYGKGKPRVRTLSMETLPADLLKRFRSFGQKASAMASPS